MQILAPFLKATSTASAIPKPTSSIGQRDFPVQRCLAHNKRGACHNTAHQCNRTITYGKYIQVMEQESSEAGRIDTPICIVTCIQKARVLL